MTRILDLRQDRNLMYENFNGYKLSLESIPVLKQELLVIAFQTKPNIDQYSLLHAELFLKQNLLHVDPWNRSQSFFINSKEEVVRAAYHETTGKPEQTKIVFQFTNKNHGQHTNEDFDRIPGDYNYTMQFLSEKYCVVCDGISLLLLLDTGNRSKSDIWKLIAEYRINEDLPEDEGRNFIICDSRLDIIQEQKQISLALGHIQKVTTSCRNSSAVEEMQSSSAYYMYVHWAKWSLQNNKWHFGIIDTLEGKGSLYYCAFEPRAHSLLICSNREFVWRSEKNSKVLENVNISRIQVNEVQEESNVKEIRNFSWSQDNEDLIIKFPIASDNLKADCYVKSTSKHLTVKCKGCILLDEELFGNCEADLTTWTIENNYIQVVLVKKDTQYSWTKLLANTVEPNETMEDSLKNIPHIEQQPVTNLEAPVEDCDFPVNSDDEDVSINRWNLQTKKITHKILLGAASYLFSTTLRPGFPRALSLRLNVDACLWLPYCHPLKPEEWSLRHEGTLPAIGYIQASKQQQRFIDCSPDLGYTLISEANHHIFLYKTKYDSANCLRNRNGIQTTIGKQHLIELKDFGEVLGVSTANHTAIILTERFLLYLQLK